MCTVTACPSAVREIFHSSTAEQANQGCLLEQVNLQHLKDELLKDCKSDWSVRSGIKYLAVDARTGQG